MKYHIEFFDKGNKTSFSKQIYTVLDKKKNTYSVLGNSGQFIKYSKNSDGIKREKIDYIKSEYILNNDGKIKKYRNFDLPKDKIDREENHYVIKFPIKIGTSWKINDLTRLKMIIGYDKVFETWIPFELTNKIDAVGENIRIKNKIFKNCIKVVGKGFTSYNVGPPLGNINIEVINTDWFAPGVGLVKTIRSETSDSEIMGQINTVRTFEQ